MKKLLCLFLAAALLFCTACQAQEPEHEIQIDPDSGSENRKETYVALYFADTEYSMLVRELRETKVSVDANVGKKVLEELLLGPSIPISMAQIINPDTQVVRVKQDGRVLTVVLSKEFLDWSFIENTRPIEESNAVKQLAVYSVINTLVEATGCPQVQILVDREGDGTGQRINLNEIGMGSTGVLEPTGRNTELILSAQKTMEQILSALKDRNYAAVYGYLAYEDEAERPAENVFVSWCQNNGVVLDYFQVTELLEQSNQGTALLMVNYSLKQGTSLRSYSAYPLCLVQENSIWKIRFSDLEKFMEY